MSNFLNLLTSIGPNFVLCFSCSREIHPCGRNLPRTWEDSIICGNLLLSFVLHTIFRQTSTRKTLPASPWSKETVCLQRMWQEIHAYPETEGTPRRTWGTEAVQVLTVWQKLPNLKGTREPHERSHGREAFPVHFMREKVQARINSESALLITFWRETSPLLRVW